MRRESTILRRLARLHPAALLLALLLQTIGLSAVWAAPEMLEITAEAGYNGKVKENRWFPVKFTLTNKADDLSGDLVVQMVNPTGGKDTTYVKHVDLPKQTAVTVWMALPGLSMNSLNNAVKFFKGTTADDKQVPFTGKPYIETTLARTMQIGVLARDPDTLNFLSLLNQKNYDVNVIHLNPDNLPAESIMLDGLDALALNDFSTDQLKQDQVKAVTGWVERGGTLLLAGGAGYPKTAKAFENLVPAAYTGTTSLQTLKALEPDGGKPLPLRSPITVSTADVKSGSVVYEENRVPLFVKNEVDFGAVWYVAYDLSLEPLASWNGNAALWEKVLRDKLPMPLPGGGKPSFGLMNNLWEMQHILNMFPSLQPPSFSLLLAVFVIYVLLVAPILYLVLKKMDKREWAWIVIPALSIVATAGIYAVGATDKSSTVTHTLNTFELNGNGQARRTTATAVFVPQGGSYQLELPKSVQPMAFNDNMGGPGGSGKLTGNSDQFIGRNADATTIRWTDVPYWSVRKAWYQNESSEPLGKFEVTTELDSSGMKGEVVNRTSSDMTDVHILLSRQLFRIGDIKAGGKQPFIAPNSVSPQPGYMDYGGMMFPYNNNYRGQDARERERQMINTYLNRRSFEKGLNRPLVVGWSKDNRSPYTVNGKPAKSDELNLWVQELKVQTVHGNQVSIPYGFIIPKLAEQNMQQLFVEPQGHVVIGVGEMTFEYSLPDIKGVSYANLKIRMGAITPPSVTLQLWNYGKQAWEPADLRSGPLEIGKDLQSYTANGKTIRMKAISTQQSEFQYPDVALEGTVNP